MRATFTPFHSRTSALRRIANTKRPGAFARPPQLPERSGGFGGNLGFDAGLVGGALGGDVTVDELDDGERGALSPVR